MAGISRHTGLPLTNLESAYQSVEVILSTRLGERVMRREFGGGVVELLGRAITPDLFIAWQQLVGTAIDLWEPRFKVRSIKTNGSLNEVRLGHLRLVTEADWRPNAHYSETDPRFSLRVDRTVQFGIGIAGSDVSVGLQL